MIKASGTEGCVCISFMSVHASACIGRGMPGGPELSLGTPGKAAQGSCADWAWGPARKALQLCHHLRALQLKPPIHSSPVLNLQCWPNHSSWSLTSVGFICICFCSNKSEEAASALEVPQFPWVRSIVPWPGCCSRAHSPTSTPRGVLSP